MSDSAIRAVAGVAATATFVVSALPMLGKAFRTRDLASYSPGNLILATAGNALYWAYVVSLPFGPIWLLHAFNTTTTLLMLLGYFAYRCGGRRAATGRTGSDDRPHPRSQAERAKPSGDRGWLPACPSK